MEHLFSPFRIKNLGLKNRIVMPSIASFFTEKGGNLTGAGIEHYRRRAAGGAAMVTMEACAVSPEGAVSPYQTCIYDDRYIEGLAKVARVLEEEGAVPAIQIHHGGRQVSPRVIRRKPVAPSPLPSPAIGAEVEALTLEGIQDLVGKFADAAWRAKTAGYKLIEVHGAHGYLVNQFLSGFSNIRKDRYGGDTVGRTRFAREIVEEVRRRVGAGFPISFKISAQEFVPGGLTVSESIRILRILEEAGVDVVQVSAGNDATPEWISQPMFMARGCLVASAAEIKTALSIPVMAVGRINDPILANKIIREGKADLVCMARGLLADPELPEKARRGALEEIRPCIACNTCMQSIFRKGKVECLVNPSLGREKEMAFRPADPPKKIAVIGGGPAGLNVAWTAASRGHEVHLLEKAPVLGGQLLIGSVPEYKQEIRRLIRFQRRQAEKFGVKSHLNCTATAETIRKMRPDVVVIATGALPQPPPFEVVSPKLLVPIEVILNGASLDRKKTVVVGGGASGCELSLLLAESGAPVTLVEMLPQLGRDIEAINRKILLQKLNEYHVRILTGSKIVRLGEKGVWIVEKNAEEKFIETERVVTATGFRPDIRLFEEIARDGFEVHRIGDCVEPRNAKAAIYEGAMLGCSI